MRYVLVNHRYFPFVGGSERYVQELAEHLGANCHDVSVVTTVAHDLEYFWDSSRREVDAPPYERLNGVDVFRLPIHHHPANLLLFPASRRMMGEMSRVLRVTAPFDAVSRRLPVIPRLRAQLTDLNPADVVHGTNLSLEGPAVVARDHARSSGVPFVLTPFIHLGVPGDPIARRYVSMPHQVQLLRDAELIIAMTELERRHIVDMGVQEHKVAVSGVGVTLDEVRGGDGDAFRSKHGIEGFLIASLGAMAADKGTFDTVRAVIELRRRGVDVELALAGPALSGFDRWLATLNNADREGIHVLGFIDAEAKRNLLAAMDALVLPSRTESFGIVYLEAWANMKPVIAAAAGAVMELVENGQNGLLVPFGKPARLAAAIATLTHEPATCMELGRNGFDLTVRRYTWDAVLERLDDAHHSVLGIRISESAGNGPR